MCVLLDILFLSLCIQCSPFANREKKATNIKKIAFYFMATFFTFIFILCVLCEWSACMHIYAPHACSTRGGQKRASEAPEPELQMVMNHQVCLELNLGSLQEQQVL